MYDIYATDLCTKCFLLFHMQLINTSRMSCKYPAEEGGNIESSVKIFISVDTYLDLLTKILRQGVIGVMLHTLIRFLAQLS